MTAETLSGMCVWRMCNERVVANLGGAERHVMSADWCQNPNYLFVTIGIYCILLVAMSAYQASCAARWLEGATHRLAE